MEGYLLCLPKRFEAAAASVNVNRFSALLRLFSFCGFGVTGAERDEDLTLVPLVLRISPSGLSAKAVEFLWHALSSSRVGNRRFWSGGSDE